MTEKQHLNYLRRKTADESELWAADRIEQLGHNYASLSQAFEEMKTLAAQRLEALQETAWAQAHRLALELECLLLDTKDNAIVSKWWDSGMEALSEYQERKPGAAEEAEAWAKMRKVEI